MRRFILLVVLVFAGGAQVAGQWLQLPLLGVGLTADAFFDDSVLHEIRLTINERDLQALRDQYLDNTYYPADFQWGNEVVQNVGIRSRGNISRSSNKPGLRVDFDRYTANQRFRSLISVVLRNNTTDASNMRERLSMLLFARLGLPASREAYTTLYINGQYAGLYTIVESIDKGFLRRSFNEDAGYLYNYQYQEPYYFEYRGSNPAEYVPLPFEPETHEHSPQPQQIERLLFTINETSAAAFRAAMVPFLDLAGFLRHVAAEAFLADDDSLLGDPGVNNFYLYRQANSTLFKFIPWDKSQAFSDVTLSVFRNIQDVPQTKRNRLIDRAIAHPDLYGLYLDTLVEAAGIADDGADSGAGWLSREIDRHYAIIREAALADPVKPFSNEEFEYEVDVLKNFARFRGGVVLDEVAFARSKTIPSLSYRHRAVPKSAKD